METIYITQISVEDIETISCLSSGKGVKAETWVLIAALGEAGGVEVGGLHWVTESDFLPRGGEATAAATRAPGHQPLCPDFLSSGLLSAGGSSF